MLFRNLLVIFLLILCANASGQQQDVDFQLNTRLLPGKKVLKVKRDFYDPYVWVLAANNEVYRVNSLTLAVNDYTAAFAVYNNLQFIDIAGRSKDTVFIATKSSTVIHFKNGAMRLVGIADGIPGTVNSVGMDAGLYYQLQRPTPLLMIGTDKGFRLYDSNTETINNQSDDGNSTVYEATYRTEFYKDSSFATTDIVTQDTIQYQPVIFKPGDGSVETEYLWEGGKSFGYNINTALSVYESVYIYDPVYTNLFWGNSRGMFQNSSNWSYYSIYVPGGHYLDNIKVNKITTIYGLTAFGSGNPYELNTPIKQNLLIGTDNGFYYSSSIYTSGPSFLRTFSLFHDPGLGNTVVNDICVNAASITKPICEDGVWIAADDGLYLLKPDYAKYVNNTQKLQVNTFKNKPISVTSVNICLSDSVFAMLDTTQYTGKTIQWYKNGSQLPFESKDSLAIKTAGDYYAVLYDPCANVHLETNHLTVQTISGPVFTFNYPDKTQFCGFVPDTLKVIKNPLYHYRWYTDGVLNGDTTATFVVPKTGLYKVEVSACTNSWIPSREVEVDMIQLPVPTVTADKTSYCTGDQATLSINIPVDPAYTINWLQNGAIMSSYQDLTNITTNISGSYTVQVVSKMLTSCSQLSPSVPLVFNPLPIVSIQQIVNTTLCDGQTVNLKATYNGGTVKWSTGENTDQITVATTGNYTATVTSTAGCISDNSINVQFFSNPVLAIKDTSVCQFAREIVTLTAPAGFTKYEWNNVVGENTFQATSPQTVNLTVTDVNGCQANQQIVIGDKCPDIHIPNSFTPNADGVNDTWVISGIENDPTVFLRVYTRYGTEIYQSRGIYTPWNGQYQNKKLPEGAYYYILSAKKGTQTFSGSLTILY